MATKDFKNTDLQVGMIAKVNLYRTENDYVFASIIELNLEDDYVLGRDRDGLFEFTPMDIECIITDIPNTQFKILGTPTTLGEFRLLTKDYPDITPFGFRNQPIQDLAIVYFGNERFIVFEERAETVGELVKRLE